jgi:hypothetical protein
MLSCLLTIPVILHQVYAGGGALGAHLFGPDAALDFAHVGFAQ